MKFRYARHSNDLAALEKFYTEIIGLEKLGEFRNHDNYDGIFLGLAGQPWHLEFTSSLDKAQQQCDEDDLLVFYYAADIEIQYIWKKAAATGIEAVEPKNPYWKENGLCFNDPDGFGLILSRYNLPLTSNDELTQLAISTGLGDWNSLLSHIKNLPYGRNALRDDFSLVLKEGRGSCSSKHALLKTIADLNQIPNIQLILGIYKMTEKNTPGIGNILSDNNLTYIPEAHCYLKIGHHRYDLTTNDSDIRLLEPDILEEQAIEAEQVIDFKVDYHRQFIEKWLVEENINLDLNALWGIREQCIENLE
jgi:hypothetical protein